MRRRNLAGLACLWMTFGTAGCESAPGILAADPNLARAIAQAGGDDSGTTRAQKPDPSAAPTISLLSLKPEGTDASGKSAARIWATVNGEAILAEEVLGTAQQSLQYVMSLPEPERSKKVKEITDAALQQIIDREVVLQDAIIKLKARGAGKFIDKLREAAGKEFERTVLKNMMNGTKAKSDDELKKVLKENGLSLDSIRRQYERQFMFTEYLRSKVMPTVDRATTHALLLEYYEKHPEEYQVPDMVDWQDLFVAAARYPDRAAARQFAESLAERLRKGEDLQKLSEQFDDGDSRLRNGAGIGRKRGEIKPADAERHLFEMKDGDVGPIIEIATGFHIIRLKKRTYAGLLPFDMKVQKEIKDKIRNEVGTREMKRIIADLKRVAVIEYAR